MRILSSAYLPMSIISNWYIKNVYGDTVLHWWTKSEKGTSRGRDYAGREGNFVESTMRVASYQVDDNIYTFVGEDGRRAMGTINTHYKNPRFPEQCIRDADELHQQLCNVKRV